MGQKVVTFFHVGEVKPYVKRMLESVRAHLKAPVVQLTDLDTPSLDVDDCVRRDSTGIAKARMEHLANFPHDEMLHLDTDVLVRRDVLDVFDREFDVALTWRPEMRSRYNSGVMFSRSPAFWAACVEWFDGKGQSVANWGGDQRSVNEVALSGRFNVLELPCDEFNWSPGKEPDPGARIVHFKGGRKSMMMAW